MAMIDDDKPVYEQLSPRMRKFLGASAAVVVFLLVLLYVLVKAFIHSR